MRISPIFIALLGLALVSCGSQNTQEGGSANTDSLQLAPGGASAGGDTSAVASADSSAQPEATNVATIATDAGDIVIELFGKDAPKTVRNFIGLAKKGYYAGIAFHRVVPTFVIQAGDPNTRDTTKRQIWGTGGAQLTGSTLEDELDPNAPSARIGYSKGTVAMANTGAPNSGGSQFFIVLSDEGGKQLQFKYSIFGRVRAGEETVRKIEQTGMQGEMPVTPVRIRKITVQDLNRP